MTEIDRPFLDKARSHIDTSFASVGKELGVNIKTGICRYSSSSFTFKLEGCLIGDDGNAVTKEAESFTMLASSYGLKPEDLHKEFKNGGDTYQIVGLKYRARKFPIQAKRLSDGVVYKFPADTVRFALMRDGQEAPA